MIGRVILMTCLLGGCTWAQKNINLDSILGEEPKVEKRLKHPRGPARATNFKIARYENMPCQDLNFIWNNMNVWLQHASDENRIEIEEELDAARRASAINGCEFKYLGH